MSLLLKNTFLLTGAMVGQKAIAFVYFVLIARFMGADITGQYFLALSLTTMVGVVADFGMTSVLIRDGAKLKNSIDRYLGSLWALKAGLIVLTFIICLALSRVLGYDSELQSLIIVAAIVTALDSIHLTLYGILRAHETLKAESLGMFAGQFATLVFGGISIFVFKSPVALMFALMFGSATNVSIALITLIKRKIVFFSRSGSWDIAKNLVVSAWPFALAAIFVKVYSSVDAILIRHYFGNVAVGEYGVAYKLTYAFQFLPMAFIAALYPRMSAVIGEGDREGLKRVFLRSTSYVALLVFPIVFGLFSMADIVVPFVYGVDYINSIIALQVLIFALLFIFFDFPIGTLLNADNRQRTKTWIMGGTMLINIVMNATLIPIYGIVGASISAVVSFVFLLFAGIYVLPKSISVTVKEVVNATIFPFISALIMLLLVIASKPVIGIYAIALGAVVYAGSMLLFNGMYRQKGILREIL